MAELGRRVSLSAPAVGERVQRLEESGVITGYSAVVDPRAIGYPIAALVRIRPARRQLHKVPEVARSTPEVVECHRVTGEDCYVAKLHLRSMDDLEGILDRFAAVGQTTTSIVHSAPVAARPLPLLDDPERRVRRCARRCATIRTWRSHPGSRRSGRWCGRATPESASAPSS